MLPPPVLEWADPVKELTGFIALFLAAGPIGFRFAALRGRHIETDRAFYDDAARRAAVMGIMGVAIGLITAALQLPGIAAKQHTTIGAVLTSDFATMLQVGLLVIALVGYLLASARVWSGWAIAAVGVIVGWLRAGLLGQWSKLINPIHSLAAALWLGTLLVLVVAGLSALLRHEPTRERRGAIAADMVNGFSPLALTMGGVLVLFGLITGWRHLHVISNLWSTPYGLTLIAKLCVVAGVFALGAWNWRRQRPMLGTELAAASIKRSASRELALAAIVLVITSILVSLPSPKA
jgi:putative copper export protein